VRASSDQVSAELQGDAVVLNLRDGVYYGLDPIAVRIWQILQEPRTIEEVRDRIMAEYDVGAEQCLADLYALLDRLMEWGLVVEADDGYAETAGDGASHGNGPDSA
jgi:hypothetical protein